MSAMFDYISGKDDSEAGRLRAELEHVMAHCVPASLLDEAQGLLKACLNMVDGDGLPPDWEEIRDFLKRLEV